jgi:capsular exopolysaccharide synthesis family protein
VEKIQKALEKARQQREQVQQSQPAGQRRAPHVPMNAAVPGEVTYQQTRVVSTQEHRLRESRVIFGLTHEALADTFRILRTQVLQRLVGEGHTTLAITSPSPGEGKTLTAVNLAISLARDVNRTVLLVDLDLRRPSVHTYFHIEPEVGLSDYLLGEASLSECLINPGIERLVILPAGRPLRDSSEMLSSPKMVGLARELKMRYPDRIVLYDLSPVLITDDAIAFLQHVECCLLVFQEGTTRKGDIERTLDLVEGCNVIGTVLNKSTQRTATYY